MSASNPAPEPTHLAINQRTQHQMIVVWHQLKRKEFDLMDLQTFMEDSFKRFEVSIFVKDGCAQVAAIQSVVQSASFISSWWSWHRLSSPNRENHILRHPHTKTKRPDPFDFLIADGPTGAGVTIYVDGKVVDDSYKTYLNKHQDPWTKSCKHTLKKGQTVDIAVDNGNNSYARDHVLVTAKAWTTRD